MDGDGAGKSDVYFCRSLDNGATWHFPVRLNIEGEDAGASSLVVDDRGGILLAWRQANNSHPFDVRLAVSRDLGNRWDVRDFPVSSAWDYWRPILAARTGGRLDLFAGRNSTSDLYFDIYSSLDYGKTWLGQTVNAGACFPSVEYPALRFGNDDQIFIAWGAYTIAGHYLSEWNYFLRRDNLGKWDAIQDLDEMFPISGTIAALAVSGN